VDKGAAVAQAAREDFAACINLLSVCYRGPGFAVFSQTFHNLWDDPMDDLSGGSKQFVTRRWLVRALSAVALMIGLGAWLFLAPRGSQPVMPTTLETNALERLLGRGNWRDLGFTLTPEHAEALKKCQFLAVKVRSTVNGVSPFTDETCRWELEKVLQDAPDCFYAEHLLGLWRQMNGEQAAAEVHYASALASAPVVLVQRFELDDGRPLAGAEAPELEIECNRVEGSALDPSLKLTFFKLTTDSEGCVRLPVYKTVYRLTAAASPPGFETHWPATGWFQSRGRTGLLPTATVTPIH
jgi:hypothetical protein